MLLFQDTTAESGLGQDTTGNAFGYTNYVNTLGNAVESALDPSRYQSFFIKLEDQAVKTGRSLAGSIKGYSDVLQTQMFDVYNETVRIGGSTKDVVDYAESFAAATGKIPAIQKDVVVSAIKISKEFGISTKEVAAMAGEFGRIGLGQESAISAIRDIGNTARRYGVNAQALTKTVQENLKKANAFTFKDGIKGLTDMAAKAQKLGMSMDSAFSVYEQFLDPDKAIEMGTEIGMLGGAFAKSFGDPMKNMNMSVEEVQENFIKAAQESAVFNAETGKFEIPKEQQKAILSFASKLNLDMKEFSSVALQGAKNTKILQEIGDKGLLSGVSDEDKELVASFTELGKGGELKVTLPGGQEKDISQLTSQDIENFKKVSETKEENVIESNDKLLSVAEKQNATLQQIRDAVILQGGLKTGQETAKLMETISVDLVQKIKDGVVTAFPATEMKQLIETTNMNLKNYINGGDFENDISTIKENLVKAITKLSNAPITGGDMFLPGGGSSPKIMSEGTLYEGIVGDQVMVGTNLDDAFEMTKEKMMLAKNFTELMMKNYTGPMVNLPKETPTLQNALSEKSTKLQEVVATTNSNINVSGGANVSGSVDVKVTGSGINLDDPKLSSLITAKVSEMIEQRLSKSWAEKQGNIQTS